MTTASETASIILLLTRWRSLVAGNPSCQVKELLVEAQRCSRLAKGIANLKTAEELEIIGRAFEQESEALAGNMQAAAYQLRSLGLPVANRPNSTLFQQLTNIQLF